MLRNPSQESSEIQLVDIRSRTFSVVSRLLLPLASRKDINATRTSQRLEVFLPRLRMTFFVNANWELECRSMPGYIIDTTQSCGTLFGLENKLVLRPSPIISEQFLLPRRVIIPEGKVSFSKMGDFTSVSINTDAEKHTRWHEYTIDTDLGCLRNDASLISKLYQCYLHALTSHCLPDPLLGHTGTEEALLILRNAASRSFQRLDLRSAKLLELIRDLTPDRIYYPPHLTSMATVKWNNLPALSQHHDFYQTVCSILKHAQALEDLYDQPATFNTPDRSQSLLNRAVSRNKSYYPLDSQISEQPSSFNDVVYRSRDVSDDRTREHLAYQTSWSIWNARPSLHPTSPKLWDIMYKWDSLGPANGDVSLRYSPYWLKFNAKRDWLVIYKLCREAVNETHRNSRIELSFSLSAAAYSKSTYAHIVPFLMIFALDQRCRNLVSPSNPSYTLSDGLAPKTSRLENLVSESALPIDEIPAHLIAVDDSMSWWRVEQQQKAKYDAAIRREKSIVARSISDRWPYYEYSDFRGQWFNESDCKQRIDGYFQSISRNIALRDHVEQLQNILQPYRNISIPTSEPYLFSPQFLTGNPMAPSYSIRDILVSRANIPTSLTTTTEGPTLRPDFDSLEILIQEFQHSPQPLLQLYGNELDRSHHALRQDAFQSPRGVSPSHELLLRYHETCSHMKERIFLEIRAALSPSENVEKTSEIAGLWPRITSRSILRQLAHDCISRLPEEWEIVIKRYAVSLLRYQQSIRLLDLSSRGRHEELLREIEVTHSDVLAESTPDWLLIQVRPLPCWRPS